jgi:hypothetical protein
VYWICPTFDPKKPTSITAGFIQLAACTVEEQQKATTKPHRQQVPEGVKEKLEGIEIKPPESRVPPTILNAKVFTKNVVADARVFFLAEISV